jgi:hypothetical protein
MKKIAFEKSAGVRMHAHTAQIRPASGTIGAAISVFFIRPLTHAASAEKSPPENSLSASAGENERFIDIPSGFI